ncbi:MAG: hypothetical protein CMG63_04250 [Candidatus Marinimicrobia bacterium]|nr:hypothetical protein [Candidatus Neomarinimicrobiota bacterium]
MKELRNLYLQITYIVFLSTSVSIVFNQLRSNPLAYVKQKVEVISNLENLQTESSEPTITGIDIKIAKELFDKNVLFIDARAEEFYNDGHIPNAICSDDFDSLVEQLEKKIEIDEQFVVYCSDSDCGSSEDLSYEFQSIGFSNILLFKGGWQEWVDADYPQVQNE